MSYNKKTGILRWKVSLNSRIKIGSVAGSLQSNGYIAIGINEKVYLAHRLIWLGVKGYFPENDIDHKDRIRHHNWWDNLREASRQCNARNTSNRKNNKSGVKGVSYAKHVNKWNAHVCVLRKTINLGYFKDFDEAVCHRLAAEQCLTWEGCELDSPAHIYLKTLSHKDTK